MFFLLLETTQHNPHAKGFVSCNFNCLLHCFVQSFSNLKIYLSRLWEWKNPWIFTNSCSATNILYASLGGIHKWIQLEYGMLSPWRLSFRHKGLWGDVHPNFIFSLTNFVNNNLMTLLGHCPLDSICSGIGVFHQKMNSENFNCHNDEMHTHSQCEWTSKSNF